MTKNYITVNVELTGRRLYNAIIESGHTVRELQEMLQFACPQSIYRWIRGKTLPSLENLYRISKYLKIPMEELIISEDVIITEECDY